MLSFLATPTCGRSIPLQSRVPSLSAFADLYDNSRTQYLVAFNAEHLRRILVKYATYYNDMRTHVSLGKDAPYTRLIERIGDVVARPIQGGLHHRYARL